MKNILFRREFLKLALFSLGAAACRILNLPASAEPENPIKASPSIFTPTPTAPLPFSPSPSPLVPPSPLPHVPPSPSPLASPTPTPTQPLSPLPFPPLIIDGHQDIAWNWLEFGRDPLKSAYVTRKEEAGGPLPGLLGERATGLPEYLAGRIGIIFASIFVMPSDFAYVGYHKMTYSSPQQAETRARKQLESYHALAQKDPRLRVILSQADLDEVVGGWLPTAGKPQVGLVILMEGADPIIDPKDLPGWHEAGLRIIGPAWRGTRYAGGTGEPGPLTELGRRLLEAMAKLDMILDLAHLSKQAYLQAVDSYPGRIIASHSNPRKLTLTDRGLTDDMVKKLVERDGVMGILPYNRYLKPGWSRGQARLPLDNLVEAIDYVVQLAGDALHVALGSDFDGGFGVESIPLGMDSIADLAKVAEALVKFGYSMENVNAILYGNWLRILSATSSGA